MFFANLFFTNVLEMLNVCHFGFPILSFPVALPSRSSLIQINVYGLQQVANAVVTANSCQPDYGVYSSLCLEKILKLCTIEILGSLACQSCLLNSLHALMSTGK